MKALTRALVLLFAFVALATRGGIEQIGFFPVSPAPISAVGLSAGQEFEGWLRLAISPDPHVVGRSLATGTTITITFPPDFMPTGAAPQVYLLRGWPQGDLETAYTLEQPAEDARTIAIHLAGAIDAQGADAPGLKAIHVIGAVRNPHAGTYGVHVTFSKDAEIEVGDAGVTITGKATASIAPFNAAHGGEDADWQRVVPGTRAPVPFDFIINDVHGKHPDGISLGHSRSPYSLEIRRAGHVLGHLTAGGGARIEPAAPATPQTIRAIVYAPSSPGIGIVRATLENGTGATLRIYAEEN